MPNIYQFEAQIFLVPDKGGAYLMFPYDIRQEFGKGRVKVEASFDGHPYKGSIVNMGVRDEEGRICYIIGIPKAIRAKIGKEAGDRVQVSLQEYVEPCELQIQVERDTIPICDEPSSDDCHIRR